MELARRTLGHLRRGIEIGGSAINPFPGVRAWNLDLPGAQVFEHAQRAIAGAVAPIDVHGTADRLPFASGSLDFVLTSHVIEHMPDPIRALGEWDRVLRPGGVCFLIVPHRDRTFDRDRPRTDLRHHLADYALRTTVESDSMAPTSHYHVWITEDFLALLEQLNRHGYLDWSITEVEDVDTKAGNGFTVVATKNAPGAGDLGLYPAHGTGAVAFHVLTPFLPFQVTGRTLETIVDGPELPPDLALPRGLYRAVPVHDGFPPQAGKAFRVEVGAPVPAPTIEAVEQRDGRLRFRGQDLDEATWLEATYPDGTVHRVLPQWEDGELELDVRGLVLPTTSFPVVAVNPPPGGGRGPTFQFGG